MSTSAVMLLLAAVCVGMRCLFVSVLPASRLPAWCREALAHLAPAVLAALVAVEARGLSAGASPAVALAIVGTLALVAAATRVTGSLLVAIGVALAATVVLDVLVLA